MRYGPFVLAFLLVPRAAFAEETYAWQTLTADGVSVGAGILTLSASEKRPGLAAVGATLLGSYFLATPIVHASHGEWSSAGKSVAMRVLGIPLATLAGGTLGLVMCGDG